MLDALYDLFLDLVYAVVLRVLSVGTPAVTGYMDVRWP